MVRRNVGSSRCGGSRRCLAALLLYALLSLAEGSGGGGGGGAEDEGSGGAVRPGPAELIRLEGGPGTLVSTLEEFLERAASESGGGSESKSAALLAVAEEHSSAARPAATARPPPPTEGQAEGRAGAPGRAQTKGELGEPPAERREPLEHHHQQPGGHQEASAGSNRSKPIPQHYQVKSLLNVTHDYPLAYSQVICGYVWPMVAAITLFTNLMIVFVLTQADMRTPTNVVLTAIAVADIIPILVPVPWFVYLFAMGNEKQVLYPPIACYFYQHSTRSVSEIFYFLSTWLNVLLACQDYLAACWPRLARRYCQIRVVVVEIVALTLLAFLLNLPQALKLVFKPVRFYYNGQLTWGCKALQARWFKDLVGEYVALYDDIFTAIIVVFVDGGPALVLITLTALLIRQLQRQKVQGHLLMERARTASKRRRERHRQQEVEASARVMIFVLLAFLAVKIPFATTYTLMIIQSRFEIHFVDNLVDFQKAITLTDLVFVLSYPINFTIFCCCSKKFRHKCVQLLAECNKSSRETRARLMRGLSANSWTSAGADESLGEPPEASLSQPDRKRHSAPPRRPSADGWAWDQEQVGEGARLVGDQHRPPLARSQSWHQHRLLAEAPPPPPPPPPQFAFHHQLPHIVTTRYESIREAELEEPEGPGYDSSSLASQLELSGQTDRPSVGRGCSDPGFLGIKHLACMVRRSSAASAGAKRGPPAKTSLGAGHRQRRSLSLSHSKLSTLPSSTGALADIMLTTFLGAAGQGARSAASEPGRPKRRQ